MLWLVDKDSETDVEALVLVDKDVLWLAEIESDTETEALILVESEVL
ncbi:hypothetical protein [Streptococcus danieliae]